MNAIWRRPAARATALGVGIGLILGVSGAFGSDLAPPGPRIAAFVATGVALSFTGYGLDLALRTNRWFAARRAARVATIGVAMTLLTTLISFLVVHAATGGRVGLAELPGFLAISLVMSAVFTALAFALFREPDISTEAAEVPVRFLERLPPKLRGAELWAVEAEDHYLRLHTSRGQDLILLRLADAVGELEGLEGAQVHRSWWVARDAVTDIRRGDGRATLTLKDGAQVPVSRTYAAALRERGWG